MSKRIRTLLLATTTIMLCVVMIVGGTYALYSSQTTFVHHLVSGTMTATLTRTKLTSTTLNEETGYMETSENTTRSDFTNATNANVFGLKDGALIVPTSYYAADMEIANKSDVAFVYYLEVRVPEDQAANEDLKLDEQLKVTLTVNGESKEATLEQGMLIGSASEPVASVGKGETSSFTIKLEFIDDDETNNAAMGQEVYFDLIVHVVQATK